MTLRPEPAWITRIPVIPLSMAMAGLVACGVSRPLELVPRPATDLPDRFVADSAQPTATASSPTCIVHLRDPRNDVRLTLFWSAWTAGPTLIGDYQVVPPGRYGVGTNELLRLDCATGRPHGIVRSGR